MGILRDIILGPDKNNEEMKQDFDEFMAIEQKRKEEIKDKKRSIFSIDEEVEGNDNMFDDMDFLSEDDDEIKMDRSDVDE